MGSQTSATVTVAASQEDILTVLLDVPNYPKWAKGLTSAQVVEEGPGGHVQVARFMVDSGPIKDNCTVQYTWPADLTADQVTVGWELLSGKTLSQMTGAYDVVATGPAQCEVRYQLVVGLRVPLPGMLLRKAERAIISSALEGLKVHVEDR